ncbi:hypothetical protein [Kocuria turfanensis]|uniref:Uncharacterized protein n=1 Tax=Kocuria turfanensis TaxID=388357 RepID=A0A512IIA0_9MICC|nr:hypothetical protein [Kocuria turfanensis]GEO97397.1 hypothetical protein KTU01_35200 [Kocuria turfanensis]
MAQRKSATKTEARERARRAAAESMAREQRLLELGEEFFVAQGEAEQIMETAEQRIAEVRAKAEQEAAQAKEAQASVVVRMKGERVAVSDIAQRLELSAAAVRALLKDNAGDDSATPKDAGSADVTTPVDSELERETVDA